MERPAWRFGSRATRQSHMRLQLCKHCAASARRRSCRSSFRRPAELARRHNLFGERFEARIAAQRIDKRVNSNPAYVGTGVILITLFKPAKRFFFVAKSKINKSKAIGVNVALCG